MDNASVFGARFGRPRKTADCRFESCQGRFARKEEQETGRGKEGKRAGPALCFRCVCFETGGIAILQLVPAHLFCSPPPPARPLPFREHVHQKGQVEGR